MKDIAAAWRAINIKHITDTYRERERTPHSPRTIMRENHFSPSQCLDEYYWDMLPGEHSSGIYFITSNNLNRIWLRHHVTEEINCAFFLVPTTFQSLVDRSHRRTLWCGLSVDISDSCTVYKLNRTGEI